MTYTNSRQVNNFGSAVRQPRKSSCAKSDGKSKGSERPHDKPFKPYSNDTNFDEFLDLSSPVTSLTRRRKRDLDWFSLASGLPQSDTFYTPWIKEKCYRTMIDFGKNLANNADSLAECLGFKLEAEPLYIPKPKIVIVKTWEEEKKKKRKQKYRKKRSLYFQRSCHRHRVHAEGRAIDLQINWLTDERIMSKIENAGKREQLFRNLQKLAEQSFDFVKIIRSSSKPTVLHVSCTG
ncbi:Oidioi.mRNA.OKI2018_I69.PAR.g10799.t1.cds [Oikopleura dioica]|uniref:Oidioi.mRNA.OKI2018_I69.PAR.g10799.t1.cds n=1 Tax=Oikopleura dioica TaxID=34765 RepID=A0ABN7RSS1_OIKDI|nr:Oidioi.mRNA.OKI2018_I69.PAR.g10799.t1.cds [Oikopleura dioica]